MADFAKHTPHTDALETLGMILDGHEAARDAIHLAVEPVIAGEDLRAGMEIGRLPNGAYGRAAEKWNGIVDPFVTDVIPKGSKFWLVLYPRQVTSLRHVWTHPDFDAVTDLPDLAALAAQARAKEAQDAEANKVEQSRRWIEDYAEDLTREADGDPVTYDDLMSAADSHQGDGWGDYIVRGGAFEGTSLRDEFWDHYAIVRGKDRSEVQDQSFLSCSC